MEESRILKIPFEINWNLEIHDVACNGFWKLLKNQCKSWNGIKEQQQNPCQFRAKNAQKSYDVISYAYYIL